MERPGGINLEQVNGTLIGMKESVYQLPTYLPRMQLLAEKKEDLETFILAYKRCLYQKGWTNIPLADEQNRKKGS